MYGFNLGQIEGLDSSVQTVTLTIANATESATFVLKYHLLESDDIDRWNDDNHTFILAFTPEGFLLAVPEFTESDVGSVYNITLAKEEVAKDFIDATVDAINQSGYPYITNNTDIYSGSVLVDEEHSGSPISISSDFPTDIPVESIPELTVKINGNSTTYSYSRGEHTFTYQADDNIASLVITQGSGDDAAIEYVDFKSNLAGVYAIAVNLEETTLDENFKSAVEEVIQESGGSSSDIKIVHFSYGDVGGATCDATFDEIVHNADIDANTIFLYNNSPSFSVGLSIRPLSLTVQFASGWLKYIYEFTLASDNTVTYQEYQTNVTTSSSPK